MFRRHGCAECSYHVADAILCQGYGIHIPFYNEYPRPVTNTLPGLKKSVKLSTFVKYWGFRRVEILRGAVAKYPSTEPDHAATPVADWEHDPFPKAVVILAVVFLNHQP